VAAGWVLIDLQFWSHTFNFIYSTAA